MKKFFASTAIALLVGLGAVPAALATIPSPQVTQSAQGNGLTMVFTYPFLVPFQSDGVTPAVTVQTLDTSGNLVTLQPFQYSITGVGNANGGTVVYTQSGGAALPAGWTIIITRSLAYTQPIAVSNVSFYPHTVEVTSDNLDAQIQQLALGVSQSIQFPLSDSSGFVLPPAADRVNTCIGFNTVGALALVSCGGGGGGGGGPGGSTNGGVQFYAPGGTFGGSTSVRLLPFGSPTTQGLSVVGTDLNAVNSGGDFTGINVQQLCNYIGQTPNFSDCNAIQTTLNFYAGSSLGNGLTSAKSTGIAFDANITALGSGQRFGLGINMTTQGMGDAAPISIGFSPGAGFSGGATPGDEGVGLTEESGVQQQPFVVTTTITATPANTTCDTYVTAAVNASSTAQTVPVGSIVNCNVGDVVTLNASPALFYTANALGTITAASGSNLTLVVNTNLGVAQDTGSIATTVLTASAVIAGTVYPGMVVTGTGVTAGTHVLFPISPVEGVIPSGYLTPVAISSGTYNNSTGVVSLTLAACTTLSAGDIVTVSSLTGTGAFASLNGNFTSITAGPVPPCTPGSGVITYNAGASLGASTITGGNTVGVIQYRLDKSQTVSSETLNFGSSIRPSTHLKVASTAWFGQDRVLTDRSQATVTAGSVSAVTDFNQFDNGFLVTGSGTSWTNSMVGGNANNPGCIYLAGDDDTAAPFSVGVPLHSIFEIGGVGSGTALGGYALSIAGSLSKPSGATSGNYTILPCARNLAFTPFPGTDVWLAYNVFPWTVGDTVEEAISPYPDVHGILGYSSVYTTATMRSAFQWDSGPGQPIGGVFLEDRGAGYTFALSASHITASQAIVISNMSGGGISLNGMATDGIDIIGSGGNTGHGVSIGQTNDGVYVNNVTTGNDLVLQDVGTGKVLVTGTGGNVSASTSVSGVTCATGSPTSSFATTNGVVIHC